MDYEKQFLADIEHFLDKTGMAASAFGMQALGDPCFVDDVRGGRSCSLKMAMKVKNFMDQKKKVSKPAKKKR